MSVNFNTAAQQQYQPQYQQYTQDYNQQPQQTAQPVAPQTQTIPEQTPVAPQQQAPAAQDNYTYIPQATEQPQTMPAVDPQVYINNQTQNYNIPQQNTSQQAIQGYTQPTIEQPQPQTIAEEPSQPEQPKTKKDFGEIIKSDEAALWTGGIVSTAALIMYAFAKRR